MLKRLTLSDKAQNKLASCGFSEIYFIIDKNKNEVIDVAYSCDAADKLVNSLQCVDYNRFCYIKGGT